MNMRQAGKARSDQALADAAGYLRTGRVTVGGIRGFLRAKGVECGRQDIYNWLNADKSKRKEPTLGKGLLVLEAVAALTNKP